MTSCLNCGGAILDPGVPYGYAGKVCHCPVHPSRMYQNPASRPLTAAPMFADQEDFKRWATRQEAMPHACGCVGPQKGQPLCPCQMRGVQIKDGRYVRIQDLGPAPKGGL